MNDHLATRVFYPVSVRMMATMGDKSPKSMRKQADQKQSKTDETNRKKQSAVASKQVASKKK